MWVSMMFGCELDHLCICHHKREFHSVVFDFISRSIHFSFSLSSFSHFGVNQSKSTACTTNSYSLSFRRPCPLLSLSLSCFALFCISLPLTENGLLTVQVKLFISIFCCVFRLCKLFECTVKVFFLFFAFFSRLFCFSILPPSIRYSLTTHTLIHPPHTTCTLSSVVIRADGVKMIEKFSSRVSFPFSVKSEIWLKIKKSKCLCVCCASLEFVFYSIRSLGCGRDKEKGEHATPPTLYSKRDKVNKSFFSTSIDATVSRVRWVRKFACARWCCNYSMMSSVTLLVATAVVVVIECAPVNNVERTFGAWIWRASEKWEKQIII